MDICSPFCFASLSHMWHVIAMRLFVLPGAGENREHGRSRWFFHSRASLRLGRVCFNPLASTFEIPVVERLLSLIRKQEAGSSQAFALREHWQGLLTRTSLRQRWQWQLQSKRLGRLDATFWACEAQKTMRNLGLTLKVREAGDGDAQSLIKTNSQAHVTVHQLGANCVFRFTYANHPWGATPNFITPGWRQHLAHEPPFLQPWAVWACGPVHQAPFWDAEPHPSSICPYSTVAQAQPPGSGHHSAFGQCFGAPALSGTIELWITFTVQLLVGHRRISHFRRSKENRTRGWQAGKPRRSE